MTSLKQVKPALKPEEKKFIKYCSDYDETCHELADPMKCFLGGNWTCQNGYSSYMPMADGICKMMEISREKNDVTKHF